MPCGCGPQSCPDFDPDAEGLSEADLARFGGDDTTCPSCGADVYHDAALCQECGWALTDEAAYRPSSIKTTVILVGGALGLAAFVFAFVL
jgi:hypothetical protein